MSVFFVGDYRSPNRSFVARPRENAGALWRPAHLEVSRLPQARLAPRRARRRTLQAPSADGELDERATNS
ncbi:MAG: hypothetical protein ACJ73L_04250 [Actinomycetes bacterium]